MKKEKPISKCQICNKETKELIDVPTPLGSRWNCINCCPIKYKKYFFDTSNTKRVINSKNISRTIGMGQEE